MPGTRSAQAALIGFSSGPVDLGLDGGGGDPSFGYSQYSDTVSSIGGNG